MKQIRHNIANIIPISGLAILLLLTPVFSIQANAQSNSNNGSEQTEIEEQSEPCWQLANKLGQLVEDFDQKRTSHINSYDRINKIYASVIERLDKDGYNTVVLVELQPSLLRKTTHFNKVSELFIGELRDVHGSACRDKASLYQELDEARNAIANVQSAVVDIQRYVQSVLLPTIRATMNSGGDGI